MQQKDRATNQTDAVRWRESEWKSNSKEVDDMTRLCRLKLESKETPTPVTKATGRRRDIDGNLVQHDVQASREIAGTSSPAVGPSMQKKPGCPDARQTRKRCMRVRTHLWAAEEAIKETVLSTVGEHDSQACCGCDARPSRITLTHGASESHGTVKRLPEMASLWRVRVAPPELMGGSSRTVWTSKQTSQILERIGMGAKAVTTVQHVRHARENRSGVWQNLTTEGSIQEARHKNEIQLKSEDTILNRTPKRKRTRCLLFFFLLLLLLLFSSSSLLFSSSALLFSSSALLFSSSALLFSSSALLFSPPPLLFSPLPLLFSPPPLFFSPPLLFSLLLPSFSLLLSFFLSSPLFFSHLPSFYLISPLLLSSSLVFPFPFFP